MPYKSLAQMRRFHAMAEAGSISQEVVELWDEETEALVKRRGRELPEYSQTKRAKAWRKKNKQKRRARARERAGLS